MRQNYYRRKTSSTEKFYDLLDNRMPHKPSLALVAAIILVVFVMFIMACFAAVSFESAESKLNSSKANSQHCSNYYEAESTAVDILTILSDDDGTSLTDKNGELKYITDNDEITISRNGGNFSFDVPIEKKETLHVIAKITGGDIDIIQWYTKVTP